MASMTNKNDEYVRMAELQRKCWDLAIMAKLGGNPNMAEQLNEQGDKLGYELRRLGNS
jgi:hypothetical protein